MSASKFRKDSGAAEEAFTHRTGQTYEIIRWQEEKAVSLGRFPVNYTTEAGSRSNGCRLFRLKNGDFLGFFLQTFYLIRNNRLIWHGQKDNSAETIFEDHDGSILMTVVQGKNQGLLRFRSLEHFQRNEFDNLLPGQEINLFLRDREGGWWASSNKNGVFYCKNPSLHLFDTADGLPAAEVKALTSNGRERMYAGLRQLDIAVFQRGIDRPTLLPRPPILEMLALRYDTLTGRLWSSQNLCFWENGRWTFARRIIKGKSAASLLPAHKIIPAHKITTDPTGTHWWASYTYDFYSIDPRTGVGSKVHDSLPYLRTFSITPDRQGNLWVTTMEGLCLYCNGHYEFPPFHHPALRFPARNVELLPMITGGGIVIALRGGGLLIRDKDGIFTQLTTRDGLTSDVLSDLDISLDGKIYACSNAGLNILSRQLDGSWQIETLTMKHGLPSNQVNDVAFLGDETWIATDKGIARFREKPAPVPMPAPVLEKFAVNNQNAPFTSNLRLTYDQNNIALRFFALHFRSGGDIPYRYRLLGGDTSFVCTHTREVNFANLAPRKYTFEVQAQNEDGQWSEPARWSFEIRPPWWATWWFRVLVSATLVAGAYLFYRNRLRAVRQEAALREKVHAMETSALRAQMNPHFIFNCLQAIQAFIATNDRDAATVYLARFAKLVRLALHGSVDGYHSLADEMAMLENYLYLEQLRFGGNFTFSIRAVAGLDIEQITLPPLLVQPFVENALWHGLKGRKSDGLIEVLFTRKADLLEVSVTDNGTGFSGDKDASKASIRPYKSMGMILTQKRLDLLAGIPASGEEQLARKTMRDENGVIVGANVRIWIPLTN